MNYLARLMIVTALVTGATACGERPSSADQAATPLPSSAAPAAAPLPAPVIDPVDSLSKTMATDTVSTKIGSVVDGRMTNSGKAGFLLYGPYVSFAAGNYAVSMKGRIEELPEGQKVRVDIASSKGRVGHGQIEVTQPGDLPAFDFALSDAVGDLEVRVFVPAGSKVFIESYRIDKKM